jgi:pantoate--beta-alanine ligase
VTIAIAESIEKTRAAVARARADGRTVGLVPTMGALHEGHASLIRRARSETGFVVVSIFVNPAQFGRHEDLARYPRPFEHDVQYCDREGADLIFHPEVVSIFPPGFSSYVEVHGVQDRLEGASRPGHFRGVATVVLKLFQIVQPDVAFFGQKDAQQYRVIDTMARDLNVPVRLRMCPIIREADGLALSSRNAYLTETQRRSATVLSQALGEVRQQIESSERRAEPLVELARSRIAAAPESRLDYVAVVDFGTFEPLNALRGEVLVAVAAFFGETRLIDNLLVDIPS